MLFSSPFGLAAAFSRKVDERRPSRWLMLREGAAPLEFASMAVALPWLLRAVPQGDGHPVLVLPGLLASDVSTQPLRMFLRQKGYHVKGWELGRNLGPREGMLQSMQERVAKMYERSQQLVSIVGWSLGGVYAREVARSMPDQVRQVITLGSPLYGDPQTSSNAWGVYHMVRDRSRHHEDFRGDCAPPVPTTSIYTRGDGVVGWGCSVERKGPQTDNIEINSATHVGLGVNPLVWYAIGDRLAQPQDGWTHFKPQGLTRLLYPFTAPDR